MMLYSHIRQMARLATDGGTELGSEEGATDQTVRLAFGCLQLGRPSVDFDKSNIVREGTHND